MLNLDAVNSVEECDENIHTLELLLRYAKEKRRAVKMRGIGEVNPAHASEMICDRIYKDLPEEARW
jgi:hypothetical protein